MGKKLVKVIFNLYHRLTLNSPRTCRFDPTCSEYALDAINKYGACKGTYLAIKRIFSCHPFSKRPFYDPA